MGGGQNKPNSHTLALTKEFSDHSPIILINSVNDYGPTHFRRSINATESATAIELREKIDEIDRTAKLSPLSATDVDVRIEKVKLLAEMKHRKLKDLRPKAKMKWDLEGDENSSFFHGIINNRRNRLRINGLAIESEWVTDLVPIKSHILHFFETKFKEGLLYKEVTILFQKVRLSLLTL
ncbi:hypothetical protein Tco_0242430 [Tanacetum coccineum]